MYKRQALDSADMTLATVFDNAPYAYSNGVEVNNWDSNNAYTGLTTIRSAITNSINVVTTEAWGWGMIYILSLIHI